MESTAAGPSLLSTTTAHSGTVSSARAGLKTVREPAREVPVRHETEVLVVGGGPAGVAAAVAAARNGAATPLIER